MLIVYQPNEHTDPEDDCGKALAEGVEFLLERGVLFLLGCVGDLSLDGADLRVHPVFCFICCFEEEGKRERKEM